MKNPSVWGKPIQLNSPTDTSNIGMEVALFPPSAVPKFKAWWGSLKDSRWQITVSQTKADRDIKMVKKDQKTTLNILSSSNNPFPGTLSKGIKCKPGWSLSRVSANEANRPVFPPTKAIYSRRTGNIPEVLGLLTLMTSQGEWHYHFRHAGGQILLTFVPPQGLRRAEADMGIKSPAAASPGRRWEISTVVNQPSKNTLRHHTAPPSAWQQRNLPVSISGEKRRFARNTGLRAMEAFWGVKNQTKRAALLYTTSPAKSLFKRSKCSQRAFGSALKLCPFCRAFAFAMRCRYFYHAMRCMCRQE